MTRSQKLSLPSNKPVKFAPHDYQRKAIKFLVERGAAGLLLDPGMGKTAITLAAYKVLKRNGFAKGALVIAPLRPVYSVWPAEIEKWEDFNGLTSAVLHGPKKEEMLAEDADIYLINYEAIPWLFDNPSRLKQLLTKVDVLVFDELSKMKKSNTKRYKSIKAHLHKFNWRWGLTGTPASNGLMDLFGECYVLDLGRALGQYITHYRNNYFYPSGYGGYTWALQDGAEEEIYAAVKPLMLRMEAADYLKLPHIIYNRIYVDLPPKARKAYDDMEEEMFSVIDEEEFNAMTGSSSSIKCEQIANGAIYKDMVDPVTGLPKHGKREWTELHTAKLEALTDLIEELQGKPLLCSYHFGHDLDRICQHRNNPPHMAVSPDKADALVRAWNAGKISELYGHPASMGHGLNMQGSNATDVALFHTPWDLELFDQYIKRVHRQGNKASHVTVHFIMARDTIDEVKYARLAQKSATQKSFMDALKAYRASKR